MLGKCLSGPLDDQWLSHWPSSVHLSSSDGEMLWDACFSIEAWSESVRIKQFGPQGNVLNKMDHKWRNCYLSVKCSCQSSLEIFISVDIVFHNKGYMIYVCLFFSHPERGLAHYSRRLRLRYVYWYTIQKRKSRPQNIGITWHCKTIAIKL